MDNLAEKILLTMIIKKRKTFSPFDIPTYLNLMRLENFFQIKEDSKLAKLKALLDQKFPDNSSIPLDYPHYQELKSLSIENLNFLKESFSKPRDLTFRIIVYSCMCQHFMTLRDSDNLKKLLDYVDSPETPIFNFINYNFQYNIKDFYQDKEYRLYLENKMISLIEFFKDQLNIEISDNAVNDFKNYLKSEYIRLRRV
jgi:hypothetical protein